MARWQARQWLRAFQPSDTRQLPENPLPSNVKLEEEGGKKGGPTPRRTPDDQLVDLGPGRPASRPASRPAGGNLVFNDSIYGGKLSP